MKDAAPPLAGLLETCLYVSDMERAKAFYRTLLGTAPSFEEARITAFRMPDDAVLLLFLKGGTLEPVETPGGTIPPHDGDGALHFALGVPDGALDAWRAHLEANAIAIESEVAWPNGKGGSLYFRDPDGHAGELATRRIWANG